MSFIRRKRKPPRGEQEEPSFNPFRAVLALAGFALLGYLVYALVSPYFRDKEPEVVIVPYQPPAATIAPSPTAAVILPTQQLAPTVPATQAAAVLNTPITTHNATAVKVVQETSAEVSSVAFSPDGTTLASGSLDGSIRLWDPTSGTLLNQLRGATNRVNSIAFSPDGSLLASGGDDSFVHLWEVDMGVERSALQGPGGSVLSVAFSPDDLIVAAGSDDGNVYVWDVTSGTLMVTLPHGSYVSTVAFNWDGSLLASGGEDDTVRLWKIPGGTEYVTLTGHSANVTDAAFSPDGTTLASAAIDQSVRLWDVATGNLIRTLNEPSAGLLTEVTFSPDGSLVVAAFRGIDDNTVRMWDAETGDLRQMLFLEGPVSSIAFSPDGVRLAAGSATYLSLLGIAEPGANSAVTIPTNAPTLTPGGGIPDGNEPIIAPAVTDSPAAGAITPTQPAAAAVEEESAAGEPTGATCTVTSLFDQVNVRSGPGVDYEAEDALEFDEAVSVDGWNTDDEGFTWWRLVDGGWVRADTVQFPEICQTLPRINP